jgi:hypothetical protein
MPPRRSSVGLVELIRADVSDSALTFPFRVAAETTVQTFVKATEDMQVDVREQDELSGSLVEVSIVVRQFDGRELFAVRLVTPFVTLDVFIVQRALPG